MEIKKDVGEIALSKKDFLTLSKLRKGDLLKVSNKDAEALNAALMALDQESEQPRRAGYSRVIKTFGMSRAQIQLDNLKSEAGELLDLRSETRLTKIRADLAAAAQASVEAEKEKIFSGAIQNHGPYSF
jgi:hypothetical protein